MATLIPACAGSGKTRALVVSAGEWLQKGCNVLIVSMTNSVRVEIAARLSRCFDDLSIAVAYEIRGSHNIFTSTEAIGGVVHVASIDAFVHSMLTTNKLATGDECFQTLKGEIVEADDYQGKRVALLEAMAMGPGPVIACGLRELLSLSTDDCLASVRFCVDEFQDLCATMVNIYTRVAVTVHKDGGHSKLVGDELQNVFGKCQAAFEIFDETVEVLDPGMPIHRQQLNVCYRCPRAHIALTNRLFDRDNGWYSPVECKPCILCVRSDHTDPSARHHHTAAKITQTIQWYLHEYKDLKLDDICILGSKTNHNQLFAALEPALNTTLGALAPGGQLEVKWFITGQTAGSIDWTQATGRIAMLTVHAMKGAEKRCVIMTDVNEGDLPKAGRQHDSVQRSLLYVGLSRSTEHLVIVVAGGSRQETLLPNCKNRKCISRYLCQPFRAVDELLHFVQWSALSDLAPHEMQWPDPAQWLEIKKLSPPPTTFRGWASQISSTSQLLGHRCAPSQHQFGPSLLAHPGLAHVRLMSMEAGIGLLAQRRLRAWVQLVEGPHSWLLAADECGDPKFAMALIAATITAESRSPAALTGKWLWNLALIDLAQIEDDWHAAERVWPLQMACRLWGSDADVHMNKMTSELADLCAQLDENCRRCAQTLQGMQPMQDVRFEVPGRVIVSDKQAMINGRADLVCDTTLYEIKASTAGADKLSTLPSSWWTQAVLYVGMLATAGQEMDQVGIIDLMRGQIYHAPIAGGKDTCDIINSAKAVVYRN